MRVRRLLLRLGIIVSFTLALSAQSHRESVTVEVIDVPVYVTRGGAPVEGLTRDDFELYVNGERQAIEYFDAMAPEQAATSLRERRLFLLLFDVAFTHPLSLGRAQRAAAHLITNAQPGDYFAVATYTSRRGVWFAAPFTRDRDALLRAVSSLTNSRSGDPLAIVMTASERASLQEWQGDADWVRADAADLASRIAANTMAELFRARMLRAAEDQVLDLADLSERLAPLDGQKHVIVLSEGYDGRAPNRWNIHQMSAPSRASTSADPEFVVPNFGHDHALAADILRMHRTFQRSNVLLHALDVEGVSNSLATNDALNWLTSGTGGKFVYGTNDLSGGLTKLTNTVSRGYRLGFTPHAARSGYNSIRVRLREPQRGTRVHHRRGFFGTQQRADLGDGLYLADVVLNDVPQSGTAAELQLRGSKLTARIPMREVAAQLPPDGGAAELLVYAFDANGTALMYHRESVVVGANVAGDGTVELSVPEGTSVAKALLRVDGSLGFSKVSR